MFNERMPRAFRVLKSMFIMGKYIQLILIPRQYFRRTRRYASLPECRL